MNWDKAFQSPFKSDVYFFSTRLQTNQHWGTPNPITIRDKEFGAVRLRGYGIYSYHIADPKTFYQKISGTRDIYHVADLEGQLRNTIIALHDRRLRATAACRSSTWPPTRSSSGRTIMRAHEAGVRRPRPRARHASSSKISRCPTSCRRCSTSASA